MSGPKRAHVDFLLDYRPQRYDVNAQLNIVRNSQRKCANMRSGMEGATTAQMSREVDGLLRQANGEVTKLSRELQQLISDLNRFAPELVREAQHAVNQVQAELEQAQKAAIRMQKAVEQAEKAKQTAEASLQRADQQYTRAVKAARRASGQQEMLMATEAGSLYDLAANQIAAAAKARREAESLAVEALQLVRRACASATNGRQQLQSIKAEMEDRRRAEEEARRIAEQQRRAATLAVEQARATFNRLRDLPHTKFYPGDGARIERHLEGAVQALNANRFQDAESIARQVVEEVSRLEQQTRQAQQEYERQRAVAEAELDALAAAIDHADATLIGEWADDPHALTNARNVLLAARQAVNAERFAEAAQQAQTARQALATALETAAANKSADEKRRHIGQTIIEVLEELGFDVSYEMGSRTEPMRIAGQTPDESGRGDFDIALPLSGEVHFEVNTPVGDTTCVATVRALEERLAERGISWQTTDWGHVPAEALKGGKVQQQVKQQERQQVKRKGS